jgi:hypothetical protein
MKKTTWEVAHQKLSNFLRGVFDERRRRWKKEEEKKKKKEEEEQKEEEEKLVLAEQNFPSGFPSHSTFAIDIAQGNLD